MRSQLLTATALSTVLIALVPVTAEAQEAYNWTGFYFGGNLGVASQGGSTNLTYPAAGTVSTGSDFEFANGSLLFDGATTNGDDGPLPTLFSLNRLSGQVSVDAGYNLQRGNFVYGVEGEFGLLNGGTAHSSGMTPSGFTTVTTDTSLSSIMSLRARGGIAADRLLFFATAGLAAGQGSLATSLNFDQGKYSASGSGGASGLLPGLIAGGGVEYAANDHVTLKVQALYYNLNPLSATATGSGSSTFLGTPTSHPLQPYTATYNPSGAIVEAGMNFKF